MTRSSRRVSFLAVFFAVVVVMDILILTGTVRGWLGILVASLAGLPIGYSWSRQDRLEREE